MSAEKAKEMIGVAMREGSHFFEWTHRRMDGVDFPADVLLTRIFQGGRAILHATVRDISERKKGEQAILRVNRALTTLSQANEVLVRATSQDGLFQEMCRVIVEAGGYRMAWIGLAENNPDKILRPVSHAGYEADYLSLAKISWADDERGSEPAGTAIRSREVQVIQDIANDTRMAPWRAEAVKRGYASVIALPLQSAGSVLGVLSLYASEPNAFGAEDVSLLTELAGDLSYGITALGTRDDRMAGLQRLERALEGTVQAIASTVEMRDAYTAGHQRRVAVIAEAIAREIGLSDDRIHGLRLASIVHDLGKINIPAEILNKPGKLSAIEYAFIKTHPRAGYDILKSVEFPWPVADIVLQHHERLDGSGYPSGLKGDAILLEARILTVADVVESMTSHRPYRPALRIDLALAEIQGGSGKLYDPLVVEACVKLARGGKMILDD
jgi:GAF domain-containing protein